MYWVPSSRALGWVMNCLVILSVSGFFLPQGRAEEEPPLAGRPPNFSGAVGSYRVSMRATPTEVTAEEPIVLTVRIEGEGSLTHLSRPDLRRLPSFARKFQITNAGERSLPKDQAREFDYELRPRSASVREIPPLPFVYFKPGFTPPSRGFQTTLAPEIALKVRPRSVVSATEIQSPSPPAQLPDAVYELAPVSAVLRPEPESWMFSPGGWLAALLLPPALSLAWLWGWRQWYPDAARLAQRQRSRAAVQALAALDRLPKPADPAAVEGIVTRYLRDRFSLSLAEPTPEEVVAHLCGTGVPVECASTAAPFLQACARQRFAPQAEPGLHLPSLARRLILDLEDRPCPASPSC